MVSNASRALFSFIQQQLQIDPHLDNIDSSMAGLHRYYKIWNNFFQPVDALNCGIGGDKVQNVL